MAMVDMSVVTQTEADVVATVVVMIVLICLAKRKKTLGSYAPTVSSRKSMTGDNRANLRKIDDRVLCDVFRPNSIFVVKSTAFIFPFL